MLKKGLFSFVFCVFFSYYVMAAGNVECFPNLPQDFNCDGIVNMEDFVIFASCWLEVVELPYSYKDVVLSDNPKHYWRLNEISGSTVFADEMGNRDLILDNGLNFPLFQQDSLIASDVVNKSITSPSFGFFLRATPGVFPVDVESDHSIEFWLKPLTFTTAIKIAGEDDFQVQLWPIGVEFPKYIVFFTRTNSSFGDTLIPSMTLLRDEVYHIVVTRSRDASFNETKKVYLNGILVGFRSLVNNYVFTLEEDTIFLWSTNVNFDELAIYDKVLTEEQIYRHYLAATRN